MKLPKFHFDESFMHATQSNKKQFKTNLRKKSRHHSSKESNTSREPLQRFKQILIKIPYLLSFLYTTLLNKVFELKTKLRRAGMKLLW